MEEDRVVLLMKMIEAVLRSLRFQTSDACPWDNVSISRVIGSLHTTWRVVLSIEQKEEGRKDGGLAALVKGYRPEVELELSTSESKVFFMKMKGYYRYLTEFKAENCSTLLLSNVDAARPSSRG
ncbi:hypothetical protein U1Q18_004802 [Sarracenia purpurea var. burkii]